MRYFSMVFDDGFKLANSARELLDIMPTVERVHIMEFASPVEAYVQAYNECQTRSGSATVPTYEEMMTRSLFFKPDYVPPVIDYRCIMFGIIYVTQIESTAKITSGRPRARLNNNLPNTRK